MPHPSGPDHYEYKYKKEMDKIALDLLSQGASQHEVAAALDIDYATYSNWKKDPAKKTLNEAIRVGLTKSRAFHDKLCRTSISTKYYNDRGHNAFMQRAFREPKDPTIKLPGLKECVTTTDKLTYIAAAACDGKISPEQAEIMSNIFNKQINAEIHDEVKREFELLKEQLSELSKAK